MSRSVRRCNFCEKLLCGRCQKGGFCPVHAETLTSNEKSTLRTSYHFMKNACCYGILLFLGFIYIYIGLLMRFLGPSSAWMIFVVPIALGILIYVGAKQTHKKAQLEALARLNADLAILEQQMAEQQARAQSPPENSHCGEFIPDTQSSNLFTARPAVNPAAQPAFIPLDDNKVTCPSCGAVVSDDGAAFCGNCGGKL